jgi:hypothetical protein
MGNFILATSMQFLDNNKNEIDFLKIYSYTTAIHRGISKSVGTSGHL